VVSTPYRQELIAAGLLSPSAARDSVPLNGRTILRLDDAGKRAALRHLEQGERGARLMAFPLGLAPWHEHALDMRVRRAGA
jgi:hypothetical protein